MDAEKRRFYHVCMQVWRKWHRFIQLLDSYSISRKQRFKVLLYNDEIILDDITIEIIKTSHDTSDSRSFILRSEGKSIVYLTDTGFINQKYFNKLKNCNLYLFESNHDIYMEMNGTKDEATKIRNIGDMGHLSNNDCTMYLNKLIGENTKVIMLVHISYHDNTEELAYKVNRENIDKKIPILLAHEHELSEIIEV